MGPSWTPGWSPSPLHCQTDSQPLDHQESPWIFNTVFVFLFGSGVVRQVDSGSECESLVEEAVGCVASGESCRLEVSPVLALEIV